MKNKYSTVIGIVVGVIIGFLNGFFGGGGGMICVPALELLLNYQSKNAHANSMLIILPLSIISAVIYLINNYINLIDIALVSIGVLIGGVMGAILLKKLPEKFIAILFCVLMLIAGIKMIV